MVGQCESLGAQAVEACISLVPEYERELTIFRVEAQWSLSRAAPFCSQPSPPLTRFGNLFGGRVRRRPGVESSIPRREKKFDGREDSSSSEKVTFEEEL